MEKKQHQHFFNPTIQTKLSVSSPDDPQEKEADAVADRVMRMAEPAPVAAEEKKEELQRKEEEQSVSGENEIINPSIQCKEEKKEEEKIQTKLFRKIYRSAEIKIGLPSKPIQSIFSCSTIVLPSQYPCKYQWCHNSCVTFYNELGSFDIKLAPCDLFVWYSARI